jgi:hypothetical protein
LRMLRAMDLPINPNPIYPTLSIINSFSPQRRGEREDFRIITFG